MDARHQSSYLCLCDSKSSEFSVIFALPYVPQWRAFSLYVLKTHSLEADFHPTPISLPGIKKSQKWATIRWLATPWQPFHNPVLPECSAEYSEALQQLAGITVVVLQRSAHLQWDTHRHRLTHSLARSLTLLLGEGGLPPSNSSSNQTSARQSRAKRNLAMEKGPELQPAL